MALLDDLAPASAYVWLRAVTLALALATLSWATGVWRCYPPPTAIGLASAPRWPAWVAFLAGVWTVTGFTQERPQQASYIMYPLAGALFALVLDPHGCTQLKRAQVAMIACATALATSIWVHLHQGWLLALGCLILTAALSLQRWKSLATTLPIAVAVAAIMAATTNPWGSEALAAARRLAAASSSLVEWQPTSLVSVPGAGVIALAVGFTVVWVRGPRTYPEIVVVLLLFVTAATAARGIAPAVLLAAPLLARHAGPPTVPSLAAQAACGAAVTIAITGVVNAPSAHNWEPTPAPSTSAAATITQSNDQQETVARLAAAAVCQVSQPRIVIATSYNDSGAALFGAQRSPCAHRHHIYVAIDGRADRYGADLIQRWLAVTRTQGDWWITWAEAAPTVAIVRRDSPLIAPLTAAGWRVVDDTSVEFVVITEVRR